MGLAGVTAAWSAAARFRPVGSAPAPTTGPRRLATRRSTETLDVATIEPVSQATVAFPVSGTVASTSVAVGHTVTIGQILATLDIADLQATLNEKQAALAEAELTLQLALNGESVTPSGGSTIRLTSATTGGTSDIVLTAATVAPGGDTQLAGRHSKRCSPHSSRSTTPSPPRIRPRRQQTPSAQRHRDDPVVDLDDLDDHAAAATRIAACKQALDAVTTAAGRRHHRTEAHLASASSIRSTPLLAQQAAARAPTGIPDHDRPGAPTSGSAPTGSVGSSPSSAEP